jgi:amino acid permease
MMTSEDEVDGLLSTKTQNFHTAGFGDKTITYFQSVCYIFNNAIGPGIVALALVVSSGGWLTPIILTAFVGILSVISALLLCETIERFPGNVGFSGRVEYTSLLKHHFPHWAYIVSTIFFLAMLQANNIFSIVEGGEFLPCLFMRI